MFLIKMLPLSILVRGKEPKWPTLKYDRCSFMFSFCVYGSSKVDWVKSSVYRLIISFAYQASVKNPTHASSRRADQSLGHGDHRCFGRGHQRIRRRPLARLPRLQTYQSGRLSSFRMKLFLYSVCDSHISIDVKIILLWSPILFISAMELLR